VPRTTSAAVRPRMTKSCHIDQFSMYWLSKRARFDRGVAAKAVHLSSPFESDGKAMPVLVVVEVGAEA
jgi:hypothetical protein